MQDDTSCKDHSTHIAATTRVTAFGHDFCWLLGGIAADLVTLEKESAVYAHFWTDETEDFVYYRIPFLPSELVAYVEACKANDEFQIALESGHSYDSAVQVISDDTIRERVLNYEAFLAGLEDPAVLDQKGCFASFLPGEIEALVCGNRPDRYESLPKLGDSEPTYALALKICRTLPIVVSYLSNRKHNRPPYHVENEYDVQDLLYACLRPAFSDLKFEEWTPKLAGKSSRIDLAIPELGLLIEVKMIRDRDHGRSVVDELKIDFESYHSYANCKRLLCVIYDPSHYMQDPEQVSNELSGLRTKGSHTFNVEVRIIK